MKKIEHKIHVQIPQKLERILLYAGGILMVLLVYVFVFQNLQLKNQDLGIKVSKLQTEHTQLLDMKNNQKAHASDTKEMQGQIDKLLKKYPADAKEEDAIMFAKNLEDKKVTLKLKVGEGGKTFGSVSAKEIAEAAKEQLGLDIDKKKLQLPGAIRELGTTDVPVKLHPKVTGKLTVVVTES